MPCKDCDRWKQAYEDYHELFNSSIIQKALLYAHKNPHAVYRKATPEYDAVRHGYFALYFSVNDSNSDVERQ